MLNFPCLCGIKFSLPSEMAGGSFQCEKCGRLVTVPTLDELEHLQSDGTYDIELAPAGQTQSGSQKEHPSDSSIDAIEGTDAISLVEFEIPAAPAPRYDPFTGELVRAVGVNEHHESAAAKAPRRERLVNNSKFRAAVATPPRFPWLNVLGQLLMAKNVAVILIMTLANLIFISCLFLVIGAGAVLFVPVPVVILVGLLGYYSLIIQETGPGEKDDLPTPLRNLEMRADLWDPFVHIVLSIVVCLGPGAFLILKLRPTSIGPAPGYALVVIGALVFPVFLLTASIDGIIANFRPDRLWGVIALAKFEYLPVIIGWAGGILALMSGLLGLFIGMVEFAHPEGFVLEKPWFVGGTGISIMLVIASQYLSYYACWQLGLIWRKHHARFPWVAQVFKKEPQRIVQPVASGAKPPSAPAS